MLSRDHVSEKVLFTAGCGTSYTVRLMGIGQRG